MADGIGDQEMPINDLVRCQVNRVILLSDTKLDEWCRSTLTFYYGAVKSLEISSDNKAAFVEFECDHAALLITRCFEYYKTNKYVPMPTGVTAVLPGCSVGEFLYLKGVPRQLSTEALHKHFSDWNNDREVIIHRPGTTDDAHSDVVVELKGAAAANYHKGRAHLSTGNGSQSAFYVIPEPEQLTNNKSIFDQDGCYKCNIASFRKPAVYENRIKTIDPVLRWLGIYTPLKFLDSVFAPGYRLAWWLLLGSHIPPVKLLANTIDPYYRWCILLNHVSGDEKYVHATMQDAMERVEKSELLPWMILEVTKALRGRPIAQVLIFGNGPFDRLMENGSVQLALALRVAESFPTAPVYFQEPRMTDVECKWLESRGVHVRKQKVMKPPAIDEVDGCRLIFCIYNVHVTVEELLRSEWKSGGTARFVLVCTDYSGKTKDGMPEEHLLEAEKHRWKMPAIREFAQKAEVLALPKFDPAPEAFSKQALLYLPEDAKLSDVVHCQPTKQECTIL